MIKRIIKIIISLIYLISITSIRFFLFFKNHAKPDTFIILYYHSVPEKHLQGFIKQMDYLKKKTIPVPIYFKSISNNNKKYSSVTFDDAFQNVFNNAIPELYKRKIHAIIFVPAGNLGETPKWLLHSGHDDMNENITTAKQLSELNDEYITIGSHTMNHPHLPDLSDEKAFAEVHDSKVFLEKILPYQIKFIAFPYGEYNEKILNLCKSVGYEQVFTIEPISPYSSVYNYVRGRIEINPWDWRLEYQLKILGAYCWMQYASKLKRKIENLLLNIKG